MNTQKEKMIKMSKVLSVVLLVCAILFTVMAVGALSGLVFGPLFGTELNSMQIEFLEVSTPFSDLDDIYAWLIDVVLGVVPIIVIIFVASLIFKAISREGTPFTKKNSDKIRVIALLLIAHVLVIPPLQMLIKMILFPDIAVSADISLINLVVAAVFFCLALVFDYGRQLQQESDELL